MNINMKRLSFKILIASTILYSCNSSDSGAEKAAAPTEEAKKDSSTINCYQYADKGDTIYLKIIHAGDSVSGNLIYQLKEKDKNSGNIVGTMKGNLLVADYTFQSEGIQSVRQIAFKKENNSFIEGYGDIISQDQRVYFRDINSLKFNDAMKLTEIVCR